MHLARQVASHILEVWTKPTEGNGKRGATGMEKNKGYNDGRDEEKTLGGRVKRQTITQV